MKIDNERLPAPLPEELHYAHKATYLSRMYKEVDSEKYGITNAQFADWISKTFNEYYLNNNHITYREFLKLG